MKHFVLTGMMGSGKTTVGRLLAEKIGRPFFDLDTRIEAAEKMSCRQIFESKGEPYFRKIEQEILERTLNEPLAVIALGGGSFINERARELIKHRAFSIYLKTDLHFLAERIGADGERPLLAGKDFHTRLEEILKEREPVYAQADLTIVTDNLSPEQVATLIACQILAENGLRPKCC